MPLTDHDLHPLIDSLSKALSNPDFSFRIEGDRTTQKNKLEALDGGEASIEKLIELSHLANDVYSNMDIPRSDAQNEADIGKRKAIDNWKQDLQRQFYDVRDRGLKDAPENLEKFSLTQQYKDKTHLENVPEAVTRVDDRLGTVLFTPASVKNDCSVFAAKLYDKLSAFAVADGVNLLGADQTTQGNHSAQDVVDKIADSLKTINRAKIPAPPDASYNHHARTQIGEDAEGRILASEAHVGKPFLLAPELHIYADRNSFETESWSVKPSTISRALATMREVAGKCNTAAELTASMQDSLNEPLGVTKDEIKDAAQKREGLVESILGKKKLDIIQSSKALQRDARAIFSDPSPAKKCCQIL